MRGGCAVRKFCTFCCEVCMMFRRCLSASWKSTVPPMALQHPRRLIESLRFPVLMKRCPIVPCVRYNTSMPCSYLAVMAATSSPTPINAASSSMDSSSHLYPARCQACIRMSSHILERRITEGVMATYSVLSTSKHTACSQHGYCQVSTSSRCVIVIVTQLECLMEAHTSADFQMSRTRSGGHSVPAESAEA